MDLIFILSFVRLDLKGFHPSNYFLDVGIISIVIRSQFSVKPRVLQALLGGWPFLRSEIENWPEKIGKLTGITIREFVLLNEQSIKWPEFKPSDPL